MTSNKDAYAKKAGKYFDEGLKERVDVFALMGKVGRPHKPLLPHGGSYCSSDTKVRYQTEPTVSRSLSLLIFQKAFSFCVTHG